MALLQGEPEGGCRARETSQASGHFRGDANRAGEHAMQRLTRNAKLACGLAYRQTEAWQDAIPQDPAWVRWSLQRGVSRLSHDLPLRHGLCVTIQATGQPEEDRAIRRVAAAGAPTSCAKMVGFASVSYGRIFTAWTFASIPGLSGIEHPIYNVSWR